MTRLLPIILCLCLAACSSLPTTKPLTQPDHTAGSVLPGPTSAPATAAEWADIVKKLDDARADNQRKDAQLQAAIKSRDAANFDTWKRFGRYSYAFTALGTILLVLTMLPWTKAAFSGFGSVALMLIGGGILFGAMPYVLENYGPYAGYPIAICAGLYLALIMALDIWRRFRKARAEAVVACAALDPSKPQVTVKELIDVRAQNNPAFAAALETEMAKP